MSPAALRETSVILNGPAPTGFVCRFEKGNCSSEIFFQKALAGIVPSVVRPEMVRTVWRESEAYCVWHRTADTATPDQFAEFRALDQATLSLPYR
jgi:hypothetical protein